jgi:TonB family protein
MEPRSLSAALGFAAVVGCCLAVVESAGAQRAIDGTTRETGVFLTKLSPPVYPPLARQARIMGDVKIAIGIRQDGSIASAEMFSGHVMLQQAALESARKSTFECRSCRDPVTSYLLAYTFEISGGCHFGPNCEPLEPHAPQVTQSEDKITLTVEALCICDPVATIVRVRVRAAKCLYLWKCGLRERDDK